MLQLFRRFIPGPCTVDRRLIPGIVPWTQPYHDVLILILLRLDPKELISFPQFTERGAVPYVSKAIPIAIRTPAQRLKNGG